MSKKGSEPSSELARAALAFDAALLRFELLAHNAQRGSLHSKRNLERAGQAINEAASCQEEIGREIQSLMAALNQARARNEETVAALQVRAQEVQRRNDALAALMARLGALGAQAKEISAAVRELGQPEDAAKRQVARETLVSVEARMQAIIDAAQALAQDARSGSFDELAEQCDSLRQQTLSARNKVALTRERL